MGVSNWVALCIGLPIVVVSKIALADDVTLQMTSTNFMCKEPIIPSEGFDSCEVSTNLAFAAPRKSTYEVFGHCYATIAYKTSEGLDRKEGLQQGFDVWVEHGYGLQSIRMTLKPNILEHIVEAKMTDLQCKIEDAFDQPS